ncbi:hypothetical protein BDB00DRAFT_593763 [Zychaea mexicana]|uniref:uncharacterized protein n=1 Tax=Zychaea mexicana TaxID=64656 RepID=UPI0022FE2629|nr:uncharacterized protein BDB00DRAFT_593763 [Zychaea mexicana]KAI9489826.1 hypothetical protein BDB00DRAFT_593763 [Zychaea mexicana]
MLITLRHHLQFILITVSTAIKIRKKRSTLKLGSPIYLMPVYDTIAHGVRPGPVAAQPQPPPTTPHPQQYRPSLNGGPMRPPPLDTSFIYNGFPSSHNNMHHQQPSYSRYPPNNISTNSNNSAYPETPALTSRPQSMYQAPPSSNGISANNEASQRSRRISVTTGDNGWKVSSIGRSNTNLQHHHHQQQHQRPMTTEKSTTSFEAGNGFNDRRMRRQSTGATVIERPITPAYTPRESYYGYFSPTHATMSPQEPVAPTMPPQPTNKRESFVGGFVLPPAYPRYRPQPQPVQQQQQQQIPPYTPSQPSHPQPQQYPGPSPSSLSFQQQQHHAFSSNSYPQHHQHTRSNSSYYASNQQFSTAADEITPPGGAITEYSGASFSAQQYPKTTTHSRHMNVRDQ